VDSALDQARLPASGVGIVNDRTKHSSVPFAVDCRANPRRLKVKGAQGQSLAYVYGRETKADADTAHVLTMDKARRIASNIPKLPTFLAAQSHEE
jgi:hypothetical protein